LIGTPLFDDGVPARAAILSHSLHRDHSVVEGRIRRVTRVAGVRLTEDVTPVENVEPEWCDARQEPECAIAIGNREQQESARAQPPKEPVEHLIRSGNVLEHERAVNDVIMRNRQVDCDEVADKTLGQVAPLLLPKAHRIGVRIDACDPVGYAAEVKSPALSATGIENVHFVVRRE